jgi:hypothetical protein
MPCTANMVKGLLNLLKRLNLFRIVAALIHLSGYFEWLTNEFVIPSYSSGNINCFGIHEFLYAQFR